MSKEHNPAWMKRREENSTLRILAEVYDLGGYEIHATFSGSGDSGSIDEMEVKRHADSVVTDSVVNPDNETWSILLSVVDKLIEDHVQHDWYNNEGGGGELVINLENLDMHITGHVYELVREDVRDVEDNLIELMDL